MTTELIVIIVESVVIFILALALIGILLKNNKKKKADKHAVYVKDGVRYSYAEKTETENGEVAVTHREGDIILEKGITYVVGEKDGILPGMYTILAAQEVTPAFNIRLGDFVREYKHDSCIVLAAGEKICPVSHSVILR